MTVNTREKPSAATTTMFELPSMTFEMPKLEIPSGFQDMAEKNIAQAKEGLAKLKQAVEEMTEAAEDTYSAGARGTTALGLKVIEITRANILAGFEFAGSLMSLKTPSEAVSLSTSHARNQYDVLMAQSKELADLAQKVVTDTTEPIKASITTTFKPVGSS